MTQIDGGIAPGFEPVREAFAANFTGNGEVGAAVSVYLHGTKVVDLWGGTADPVTARPWTGDTLTVVYSTTKSVPAACAHLLAQRGELNLDAPVADYWPEFAAEGKDRIPVRHLLSHSAGLPALDRPVALSDALAWHPMAEALAAQRPFWEPGVGHGYHAFTYGWLVGEVIRRVSGRSPGRFFADEIAAPLGLDFWIGLPKAEQHRVSRLIETPPDLTGVDLDALPEPVREIMAAFTDPTSLTMRAYGVVTPPPDHNDPQVQQAEIPATGGICTAEALARFYAGLIGEVDGVRLLDPATLADAVAEQASGTDRILRMPTRLASGFGLPTPDSFWYTPTAFGFGGRGGSLGFADPATGLAFGYVMNGIQEGPAPDLRAATLVEAVRTSLPAR
ncbi:serine hydrolase domain-containing protein [Rhizohabitans arisaemae]|uniref:serine hydrolase domain-containing protein n=1 Tax=Rhizohabitans arisaemae TaxID=2720610 RepID=UPI0024B14329|nr:serine hydrolase domain-containing protein [Rhizohabitans arisaemae]